MRNDELNINNDELVDMVLLQAEAIQILIGKVEKLETGIDKLEKDLTDKIGQLEKRAGEGSTHRAESLDDSIQNEIPIEDHIVGIQQKKIESLTNEHHFNCDGCQ